MEDRQTVLSEAQSWMNDQLREYFYKAVEAEALDRLIEMKLLLYYKDHPKHKFVYTITWSSGLLTAVRLLFDINSDAEACRDENRTAEENRKLNSMVGWRTYVPPKHVSDAIDAAFNRELKNLSYFTDVGWSSISANLIKTLTTSITKELGYGEVHVRLYFKDTKICYELLRRANHIVITVDRDEYVAELMVHLDGACSEEVARADSFDKLMAKLMVSECGKQL